VLGNIDIVLPSLRNAKHNEESINFDLFEGLSYDSPAASTGLFLLAPCKLESNLVHHNHSITTAQGQKSWFDVGT